MTCPYCKSENISGHRFCGACGKPIDGPALDAALAEAIDARIHSVIDRKLQNQNLVEITTAQAVVTRITDWAKLFSLVTAVPLAILLASLAIWGVTSFLDFRKKVETGKAEISSDINDTRNELATTKKTTEELKTAVQAAKDELGSLPLDVKSLQSKVAKLEEKIGFVPTPELTPQLKTTLQSILVGFQGYCKTIGFRPKAGDVHVRIERDVEKTKGTAAYYDPRTSEMVVDAAHANDPTFALREYMHRTLLPEGKFTSNGGYPLELGPIESGLASYFPASFLNSSKSEFYDLSQLAKAPEIQVMGETMGGIRVWGSAFWELRTLMGKQACDTLLVRYWDSLDREHRGDNFGSYAVSSLLQLYRETGGKEVDSAREIFARRGLI
jgi:hypothetical protein